MKQYQDLRLYPLQVHIVPKELKTLSVLALL
nr:MAG TPA: hypothetical protein [Caudoviricetes sp.]